MDNPQSETPLHNNAGTGSNAFGIALASAGVGLLLHPGAKYVGLAPMALIDFAAAAGFFYSTATALSLRELSSETALSLRDALKTGFKDKALKACVVGTVLAALTVLDAHHAQKINTLTDSYPVLDPATLVDQTYAERDCKNEREGTRKIVEYQGKKVTLACP